MRTRMILLCMILASSLAHGQVIAKDEAIRRAKEWAQSVNPPMNPSQMQEAQAVYMPNENSWIVDFAEDSDTAAEDSDYMLRVEATSGKSPELLRGSQKLRYRSYFEGEPEKQ